MLSAARPSPAPQPAATPSRDAAPVKPQTDADQTERFASALARQKGEKGKAKTATGTSDLTTDTSAPVVAPPQQLPVQDRPTKQNRPESPDMPLSSATAEKSGQQGMASPADLPPATGGGQELAAQFAARAALPQAGTAQSQIHLDERLYAVSHVVIEGDKGEGLSISYESSSDTGTGHSEAEDNLRRRLEARGLTIGAISWETSAGTIADQIP
jgi:hypothetical protein